MVYRVGEDDSTRSTATNVTGKNERSVDTTTAGVPMYRSLPSFMSSGLGENEELKIVGHGDETNGRIGGLSPVNLVAQLIQQGLNAEQHKGDINLIVCLSGIDPVVGHAIADAVCYYLRGQGFSNRVIGYGGMVHADPDGSLRVVPPDRQAVFLGAKKESENLSAIDRNAKFAEMVTSDAGNADPDSTQKFDAWEVALFDAMQYQLDIMQDCYVTLGAHPELRRVVNFPAVANKEQWARMQIKWAATMNETLATGVGQRDETTVSGRELDPTKD